MYKQGMGKPDGAEEAVRKDAMWWDQFMGRQRSLPFISCMSVSVYRASTPAWDGSCLATHGAVLICRDVLGIVLIPSVTQRI